MKKKFQPATLLKKRLQQRCFPMSFSKFSRASFLQTSPVHCFWIFSPPLLDYSWILLKIYCQILARKKTAMSLFLDQTVNALFQKNKKHLDWEVGTRSQLSTHEEFIWRGRSLMNDFWISSCQARLSSF